MFWKKSKSKVSPHAVVVGPISTDAAKVCHIKYANLDLRRAVLDWRDDHIENVENHLSSRLDDLYRSLDQQLDAMSVQDLLKQGAFGKRNIEPVYKQWLTQEVTQLSKAAQDDLAKIFVHAWEFSEHVGALNQPADNRHYTDAAVAAAATGAGIAAIPAFAAMSAASAGGVMGLLGVSTLAWPIVAVGVASVSALLALGGYKAKSLKSNAVARYRKGVIKSIEQQIFGQKDDEESVCQRMQLYIQRTAEEIVMEID